jgi:excisionase family DNA binding protein
MKRLYTPQQAAEALSVSRSTIYKLLRDYPDLYVPVGSQKRIPAATMERLTTYGIEQTQYQCGVIKFRQQKKVLRPWAT